MGEYPIEAVRTMARIISSTEGHALHSMAAIDWQPRTKGGVIAKAAAEVAERVGAKYLVAFTQSGDSAKRLSRYRGPVPVLAFTPDNVGRVSYPFGTRQVDWIHDLPKLLEHEWADR